MINCVLLVWFYDRLLGPKDLYSPTWGRFDNRPAQPAHTHIWIIMNLILRRLQTPILGSNSSFFTLCRAPRLAPFLFWYLHPFLSIDFFSSPITMFWWVSFQSLLELGCRFMPLSLSCKHIIWLKQWGLFICVRWHRIEAQVTCETSIVPHWIICESVRALYIPGSL